MNLEKRLYVGITNIPGRESSLIETIDSILASTRLPDRIFVTVFREYRLFGEYNLSYLDRYSNNDLIEVILLDEDLGPCSKLLGCLTRIGDCNDNAYVLLLDDDHIYRDYMIDTFQREIEGNDNSCYSYYVYKVRGISVGQGADGFLINTNFLKCFREYYNFFMQDNDSWFFNDDLLISTYLHNKRIAIECMRKHLRNQDQYIYTLGSGHYIHGLNRMTGKHSRRHLNEVLTDSFLKYFPDKLTEFQC